MLHINFVNGEQRMINIIWVWKFFNMALQRATSSHKFNVLCTFWNGCQNKWNSIVIYRISIYDRSKIQMFVNLCPNSLWTNFLYFFLWFHSYLIWVGQTRVLFTLKASYLLAIKLHDYAQARIAIAIDKVQNYTISVFTS